VIEKMLQNTHIYDYDLEVVVSNLIPFINGIKQWYAEPMTTSRNSWSDPYFDKEAGNIRRG